MQANLPDDAPRELRSCCSEDLRLTLFELVGSSIDTLNEKALIEEIRKAAVKCKNTAVHRQEFYSMRQEEGQSAQQFLSKLKSKAEHCGFQLECSSEACNHKINTYKSAMIADILTVGYSDSEIQGELLAQSGTIKTLDEKFDLIQAMESGKSARNDLITYSSIKAQKSTPKKPPPIHQGYDSRGCSGCGSTSHGPGTNQPRKKHCPARAIQCDFCKIVGHFSSLS